MIASLAGALFSFAYMRYIDRNIGGIAIKELLRSFILFWLTSDANYFEKELEKYGVEKKGSVKCLTIGDVKITSSTFHPGPIRNIGGGSLVGAFLERYSMYLHSASKHEDNPVSGREVEKIVSSVVCDEVGLRAFKPFSVEGKRYTLHVFPFDHATLLILDGRDAADDLPSQLNDVAKKYFINPILCEAHSCYAEGFEVSAEDILEIEELFERASDIETEQAELKYAFHTKKAESQSLCGHISFLLLRYVSYSGNTSEKYGILLLDSNNVERELKRKVEEFGDERGVKIIVTSTDNHAKTGVSPKIGYKPAGLEDWSVVQGFLEEALAKEVKKAEKICYGINEVVAKVMGRRFFESVERAFREIGETAIYLFLLLSSLNIVLTVLLGLTII
jgi:putative membrane protein